MALGDLANVRVLTTFSVANMSMNFGIKALTASSSWRADLAVEFQEQVMPTIGLKLCDTYSFDGVVVNDIVPGTGVDEVYDNGNPAFGDVGLSPLPPLCAGLISWRSALTGRSNRGRTYVPGLAQSWTDGLGNSWDGTGFAALQAIANKVMEVYGRTAGTSSLGFLVVISRQENGVPRGPVGVQIDSYQVDSYVRSQRKRMRNF